MTDDEYHALRQPLLDMLHELKTSYERDAAPILKKLADIENVRPRPPFVVLMGNDALDALLFGSQPNRNDRAV